jgi:hypothetical protein
MDENRKLKAIMLTLTELKTDPYAHVTSRGDRKHAFMHVIRQDYAERSAHVDAYDMENLNIYDLNMLYPGIANHIRAGDIVADWDYDDEPLIAAYMFNGHDLSLLETKTVNKREKYTIMFPHYAITKYPLKYYDHDGFNNDTIIRYAGCENIPRDELIADCHFNTTSLDLKELGIHDQYNNVLQNVKEHANKITTTSLNSGTKKVYPYMEFSYNEKKYILIVRLAKSYAHKKRKPSHLRVMILNLHSSHTFDFAGAGLDPTSYEGVMFTYVLYG